MHTKIYAGGGGGGWLPRHDPRTVGTEIGFEYQQHACWPRLLPACPSAATSCSITTTALLQ